MKATHISIGLSTVALIVAVLGATLGNNSAKIGYVRSNELIYSYKGMKEAQKIYEAREKQWQSELDTLRSDYQRALNSYSADFSKISEQERKQRGELLSAQEEQLSQHSYILSARMKEEEEKMTQGVLNQVNSIAVEYGREHGFDIVLGTTKSGNILYGDKALDITEDLLKSLNEQYGGNVDSSTAKSSN